MSLAKRERKEGGKERRREREREDEYNHGIGIKTESCLIGHLQGQSISMCLKSAVQSRCFVFVFS